MTDALAPYSQLVTLAEASCAHVAAGRLDELEHIQAEFGLRLAELHGPDPQAAEPLLRRAFALHGEATAGLQVLRAAIAAELGSVRRERAAAAGYAPVGAPQYRAVDRAA